jgi:hypothetical protein
MAKKKSVNQKAIEKEVDVEAINPDDIEPIEKKVVKKDSKKNKGDLKLIPPKYRKFHK